MPSQAQGFVDEVTKNIENWYSNRIDYPTFCAIQAAIWQRIDAAPPRVGAAVIKKFRPSIIPCFSSRYRKL